MSEGSSGPNPKLPESSVYHEFIKVGLEDPFIRGIVGVVAIATAAGFAISILGDPIRAALAVGLSLMFGVILAVLRVLMNNLNSAFVRGLCFLAASVIVGVFLLMIVLTFTAATICWPTPYSRMIQLRACVTTTDSTPFTPSAYTGKGITLDPANAATPIYIFYRRARQPDAEQIAGALMAGGYPVQSVESDLNEVVTDNRTPGLTLIKFKPEAQPATAEVQRIVRLATPTRAPMVTLFPTASALSRGAIQVDLF